MTAPNISPVEAKMAVWNNPHPEVITFLAHEIRNPLTNIKMATDLMETEGDKQTINSYLEIIRRSSVRIDELVKDLLKYHEALEEGPKEYYIHQMLDEVLLLIADRLRLKAVVIRKAYTAHDFKIVLESQKMKIALSNIIINAIEAMPTGRAELKLVTKLLGDRYVLQIEDTGCGISKENLEHIFKPYFSNKAGGMGLGLSTTRDILRANQVEVKVESKEGEGTKFILFFKKRIF